MFVTSQLRPDDIYRIHGVILGVSDLKFRLFKVYVNVYSGDVRKKKSLGALSSGAENDSFWPFVTSQKFNTRNERQNPKEHYVSLKKK